MPFIGFPITSQNAKKKNEKSKIIQNHPKSTAGPWPGGERWRRRSPPNVGAPTGAQRWPLRRVLTLAVAAKPKGSWKKQTRFLPTSLKQQCKTNLVTASSISCAYMPTRGKFSVTIFSVCLRHKANYRLLPLLFSIKCGRTPLK